MNLVELIFPPPHPIANYSEWLDLLILSLSFRWKEVIDAAVGGGVSQIQTLVEKMPDVAEVSIHYW